MSDIASILSKFDNPAEGLYGSMLVAGALGQKELARALQGVAHHKPEIKEEEPAEAIPEPEKGTEAHRLWWEMVGSGVLPTKENFKV